MEENTAKAAATLQVLSGGRLILGAGAGYQKVEFEALGVDFHKRGKLFDEALDVIRMAWNGGAVVHQGSNFNATGNEPRPVPPVQPPIWIGGGSGKAVERAALRGDGWSPFFAAPTMTAANQESGIHTVEQLGENIKRAHDMRAAHGITGPFDIAIGSKTKLKMGDKDTAAKYLESIAELAEAGVTWTMIELPHPSRAGFVENVAWFGEEVLAKLRPTNAELPIIVLTAKGGIDSAVEAMRAGANDFLVKPASPERIAVSIRNQLKIGTLSGEVKQRK